MKKEGIQTRNRKLSSKSKKKKGGMGMGGGGACALALGGVMGDMIKPLGDATKGFGGSAFPSAMDFGTWTLTFCLILTLLKFMQTGFYCWPMLASCTNQYPCSMSVSFIISEHVKTFLILLGLRQCASDKRKCMH